jgi:hypothetical protein
VQVIYVVTHEPRGWAVRRGATAPMHYETVERALRAAENLARAAAEAGEVAMVNVREHGREREYGRFLPDRLRAAELVVREDAGPHGRLGSQSSPLG